VAADRPQGFVTAILADEAPDGAQSLISRGFANLTHRISAEVATPVIAGEEMEISVTLHGMAWQVPAGHRLVLHLASTYWPILWPSPEPVTLSLRPGLSAIEIPVLALRTNAPPPRDLAPPSPAAPSQTTQLSEGSMARDITTDLITGTIRHRMFIDGGVFGPIGKIRFDAIGTEFHDVSERIYEIHPDDPLSAKATMTQSRTMERGNWKVRIETTSEMTASSDAFHLSAHVECWEGDTPFHRVDWSHNIPRNGM
ncbi:MAG: CocE/NonD family hydrolase C-terminal non-catalytic domain-containing protein, partial [Albidovulum sp.]